MTEQDFTKKFATIPFIVPNAEQAEKYAQAEIPEYQRVLIKSGNYTAEELFAFESFRISAQRLQELEIFVAYYRELIAPELAAESKKSSVIVPGMGRIIVPS